MPYLSIIFPCYKVQAYLRQSLDSILSQSFSDVEVIAIDDASPDHSGAILDEYALRDDRVTVVHLDENVGLGAARNIGFDRAAGEYVLFVDSDDWLADGALEAIASRLRRTEPDLLFFDYVRTDVWPGPGALRGREHPPVPDVCTLQESPHLMNRMMTAWSRAYRRDFLLETGLRNWPGYYEDLAMTYPSLMAAKRISVLDRVCYCYRQRPTGASITRTPNRKHFAVFDQYERIFDFMGTRDASVGVFRPAMFGRMMWHYLIIFQHAARIPRDARKEFFLRMADHYRRFKPAGYRPPGGNEGWKYRLIERGSYRTFQALRSLNRARAAGGRSSRPVLRRARAAKRALARGGRRAAYRAHLRLPMRKDLALFASYWSRLPSANSLAIYEKLRELAPHIHAVWVVRASEASRMPPGFQYVVDGSLAHHKLVARAKYLVSNANFPSFAEKRPGSVYLQAQHGTPLKTMGAELKNYPIVAKRIDIAGMLSRSGRWDYSLSSNRHSSEVWERVYRHNFESLEYGYPCNDRYYKADAAEILRIRTQLGIEPGTTAILYAPTHRDYRTRYEQQFDAHRVAQSLHPDQVLLVRAHYFYRGQSVLNEDDAAGRVIDVSEFRCVEDLCLAADVLLTDYSSIMFDFANLARPIVIYADDYDTYRRVRGVTFDVLEEPPGEVATTEDQLLEILRDRRYDSPAAREHLSAFRRRFCEWDDGDAAERVVRKVFLEEEPPPPVPFEKRVPAPAPSKHDANASTTPAQYRPA